MGSFLENEKARYIEYKASTPHLTDAARAEGLYRGRSRPFCLPIANAEENLFPGIRESAPAYFASQRIKWHDGQNGLPSNHLCDSQVCCVNFLMPFADQPRALAQVLRPYYPCIRCMLPIESGQYVACEWIGQENYLGEKISRNGQRTRGANYTSADAAVLFERTDGLRQIVLIEWKYTESYAEMPLHVSASGTSRVEIYAPLFRHDDCPIDKTQLPSFEALFYEPFYQLLRQQMLAHEMERARELGADVVSLLHIAPARNADFRRVTSPELRALGQSPTAIWQALTRHSDRFMSVSTEALFGGLCAESLPEMQEWLTYIYARYEWVRTGATVDQPDSALR